MQQRFSLIVAMSENRVIGREGTLPWRMPADLAHFKAVTMGKPIVMGRRNYEDIGRPLPGRTNIVITRQQDFTADGCIVVHTIEEAAAAVPDAEEIMVIGGAEIYAAFLPRVSTIYLTIIHTGIEGDVFFPEFDMGDWRVVSRELRARDENNEFDCSFIELERFE